MQLLLHRAEIPCTLVSGIAQGESHMWNLVEIGGRNYHLDPTWNDAEDWIRHTYFNLNTEELLLSHTPSEQNLGVDTCAANEANYYRAEGRYLETYDRSLIAEAVAAQVNTGADTVDLRFSPETFAVAKQFMSNARLLRQYTNPFLNGNTLWSYVYQANDAHCTLTLYKEV